MSRRRARVAVLGGTFDRLHAGHRALLSRAFAVADQVGIGVTTDAFLLAHPKPLGTRIQPYEVRRRRLRRYLRSTFPGRRFWLAALSDPYGRSVEPGVDVLVASADSARGARAVNRERARRRLAPVRLSFVPLVVGDDGLAVSSRRIRAGLIDGEGHRLRPLRVHLQGPLRTTAVGVAFRAAFPGLPPARLSRPRNAQPRDADYALTASRSGKALQLQLASSAGRRTTTVPRGESLDAAVLRLLRSSRAG